jgi:hypothetical protein
LLWREKSLSSKIRDEDKIRRAAEQALQRVREDYPQATTEIDLDTIEAGEDAYLWIAVDTLYLIDGVRAVACNYVGNFWQAEDIFIVPRMR